MTVTGKHLHWILFFSKIADLPTNLLQKRLQHRCEVFKITYFVGLQQMAASGF